MHRTSIKTNKTENISLIGQRRSRLQRRKIDRIEGESFQKRRKNKNRVIISMTFLK